MIHVLEMAKLVHDHIVDHFGRINSQAPVQNHFAVGVTAPPASFSFANLECARFESRFSHPLRKPLFEVLFCPQPIELAKLWVSKADIREVALVLAFREMEDQLCLIRRKEDSRERSQASPERQLFSHQGIAASDEELRLWQRLFLLGKIGKMPFDPVFPGFQKIHDRVQGGALGGPHLDGFSRFQDNRDAAPKGFPLHLNLPSPIVDPLGGAHSPRMPQDKERSHTEMAHAGVETSFYQLDPEAVMSAAEAAGYQPTGEFQQLNSYENRVFDLSLETGDNVIAKFYRPGRWSREAIQEEHDFLLALKAEDIHAVAPLVQADGSTVSLQDGLLTAFFPKVRGRLPDEFLNDDLARVGRLIARVHMIGARREAEHRPTLDAHHYGGWATLDFMEPVIVPEIRQRYFEAAENIIAAAEDVLDPSEYQRIHGDCHRGNLLSTGKEFFLVDFDDFLNGPVVHDFWMLLSGDDDRFEDEQNEILEGYEELMEFPHHQWEWIPILRGLRIIRYSGWIAERWKDPSFPRLFPDYGTYPYWAREVEALEKIAWQLP